MKAADVSWCLVMTPQQAPTWMSWALNGILLDSPFMHDGLNPTYLKNCCQEIIYCQEKLPHLNTSGCEVRQRNGGEQKWTRAVFITALNPTRPQTSRKLCSYLSSRFVILEKEHYIPRELAKRHEPGCSGRKEPESVGMQHSLYERKRRKVST
jgi:hypothetical protein